MDMPVQVNPSIEMVLKTWDWVMAEHDLAPVVIDFHVFIDLRKLLIELAIVPFS